MFIPLPTSLHLKNAQKYFYRPIFELSTQNHFFMTNEIKQSKIFYFFGKIHTFKKNKTKKRSQQLQTGVYCCICGVGTIPMSFRNISTVPGEKISFSPK